MNIERMISITNKLFEEIRVVHDLDHKVREDGLVFEKLPKDELNLIYNFIKYWVGANIEMLPDENDYWIHRSVWQLIMILYLSNEKMSTQIPALPSA